MSERWGWTSAFGGMRMAFGRVKETKERGEWGPPTHTADGFVCVGRNF
jgi:hypothetical protein